jgi:hypothetical protein
MNTTYDYIYWRGDLSFSKFPINEIDSLIFALLSNIEYSTVFDSFNLSKRLTLKEIVKEFEKKDVFKNSTNLSKFEKQNLQLLKDLCKCDRFSSAKAFGYKKHFDEKQSVQFSAISFIINDTVVISYRGTDSTLVGWKEDFAMSFSSSVGAQQDSLDYINEVAKLDVHELVTCGHSKGGNLAVYSALKASAEIQHRISSVYNFDGPGFNKSSVVSGEFEKLGIEKVTTIVPQSSMVGILMQHEEPINVVHSSNKTGIFQHYPLTWEVSLTQFRRLECTDNLSKSFDQTTKLFLESMDESEMEDFTNALFEMFHEKGALTFRDVMLNPARTISTMHSVHQKIPKEYRNFLETLGKAMVKASIQVNLNSKKSKQVLNDGTLN